MSPLGAAVVAGFGVAFLAWAWTLLATLRDVLRRMGPGAWVAGPARQVAAVGAWWRDPAATPRRRRLILLSLALLGLTVFWEAAGLEPGP